MTTHLREQWRNASTWRGFSDEPFFRQYDAVIATQMRGRQRYYEVWTYGQNFANYPRLDEAKSGLEAIYGPLDWQRVSLPKTEVLHYYFGWTDEFSDPVTIYVVPKLPRLGTRRVAGLRVGPGVFWRVHPKGRPFEVGGGTSGIEVTEEERLRLPEPLTRVTEGYSSFSDPWHLWQYVVEMGWADDSGEYLARPVDVIGFEGRVVGSGFDGEPAVVPASQPFARMSWEEFDRRVEGGTGPWYEGINVALGKQAGLYFKVHPEGRAVYAYDPDSASAWHQQHGVGMLSWDEDGMITWVQTYEPYQRQGVATWMFERAKEIEPRLHHSPELSGSGREWVQIVGKQASYDNERALWEDWHDLQRQHPLSGWRLEIGQTMSPRAAGTTYFRENRIAIATWASNQLSLDKLLDTLRHEVAHALAGPGAGHGVMWKAKCLEVGADPNATFHDQTVDPGYKWIAECPNCGPQGGWFRKPSREFLCADCNSDINVVPKVAVCATLRLAWSNDA